MNDPNEWNQKIIEEFRANGGVVGPPFEGVTLLLLHTVGAKSGLPRINPVVCVEDEDRFVIAASKAGAPSNPDWYYNLLANPNVEVEVGTERFAALAVSAPEPQRTTLYDRMAAKYPQFGEYQSKTERVIPVIVLTRL